MPGEDNVSAQLAKCKPLVRVPPAQIALKVVFEYEVSPLTCERLHRHQESKSERSDGTQESISGGNAASQSRA